jgi:YesN/AraC family two-component response regulator
MDKKIDLKTTVEMSKNISLLYVEDDTVLRNKTYLLLRMLFKDIEVAENGLEGFAKYESRFVANKRFDLIVTDINMPVLDGFELSKKILELDPNQQIIIVSAYNDADKLEQITLLGIDNFLHKPIKEEALLTIVNKVVTTIAKQNSKTGN